MAATTPIASAVSGSGVGPGWIATIGSYPGGGTVTIEVEGDGPHAFGLEVRTSDLLHFPSWSISGRPSEVGLNAIGRDVGMSIDPSNTVRRASWPIPADTSAQILIWVAGGVDDWRWQFEGASSIELAAWGKETYYWDGAESSEGTHVHASIDGRGFSVSSARYQFQVEGEFRGFAGSLPGDFTTYPLPSLDLSEDNIWLERPSGGNQECLCLTYPPWGPGVYALTWEGYSAHSTGEQPVLLAGVDAPPMFS